MKRITSYVQLRKEGGVWYAYFRGTNNRIKHAQGTNVMGFNNQSDLRRFLLTTTLPLEHGVIVETRPTEAEKVKLEGRF